MTDLRCLQPHRLRSLSFGSARCPNSAPSFTFLANNSASQPFFSPFFLFSGCRSPRQKAVQNSVPSEKRNSKFFMSGRRILRLHTARPPGFSSATAKNATPEPTTHVSAFDACRERLQCRNRRADRARDASGCSGLLPPESYPPAEIGLDRSPSFLPRSISRAAIAAPTIARPTPPSLDCLARNYPAHPISLLLVRADGPCEGFSLCASCPPSRWSSEGS